MLVLFLLPIVKPKTHSLSTNVLWLKNKGYKCYWEFIRVNAFSYKYNTTLLGIFEYKSNIFFGKHYILWFQKRLILFPRKYVCDPIRSYWLVVLLTFRQKSQNLESHKKQSSLFGARLYIGIDKQGSEAFLAKVQAVG